MDKTADAPSATKGYLNTSDWTWTASEIHDLSTRHKQGQRSKLTTLRLDQTMQMRWVGGNISGEGDKLIHFTGHNHHIAFVGTTLYSDSMIHCDGLDLKANRIETSLLINPGDLSLRLTVR